MCQITCNICLKTGRKRHLSKNISIHMSGNELKNVFVLVVSIEKTTFAWF